MSALAASLAVAGAAMAEATPDEIARLGADLTPLGAERAGNAGGTIPEWTGGLTKPPPGYVRGEHHVNPYPDDKVEFRIDQSNMAQYADKLSVGQKAILSKYETFHMNVYPTRRSAAVPQRIYDATRRIAATAQLADGGNGVTGAIVGIPFPIPENGMEVIWNHLLRYRGVMAGRWIGQAAPTVGGDYTMVKFNDEFFFAYADEGMTEESLNNIIIYFIQKVLAPASLAGGIILVHETLDQVAEPRRAWSYNVGTRRVRQAPNIAYDNPGTASDGLRTNDQFDMFNGALDLYDWTLLGKREMYVPYNSYELHGNHLQYDDILTPQHVNPDHLRYELHRVWVVDSVLKPGKSHIYKRRTFYVDEDSWQILVVDIYDERDQLWRVSEGHVINYYENPLLWTTLEVHTDLQARRYLAIGLDNQERMYDYDIERTLSDFTPQALRRLGR
ncbi:MAG: DUF1329 domain-containing protein [Gammaproteobacteria bacterium]|nr:DUF1329 domain-containing protein [Gammaproteobacteria bacterium]